ncbi:hypothetical protein EMIT079MI2_90124 [Bacillus sp. IT-79MI2]
MEPRKRRGVFKKNAPKGLGIPKLQFYVHIQENGAEGCCL